MSFFPILDGPNCIGETTVFNFSPNNWETAAKKSRYLYVSYSDGSRWVNQCLGSVAYGDSVSVTKAGIRPLLEGTSCDTTPFLWLSSERSAQMSDSLPTPQIERTCAPAWRSNLRLRAAGGANTSYQGEIDPFPDPGSLLTFGFMLQPTISIKNYLFFLNLERNPKRRKTLLEVRDAREPSKLIRVHEVFNNCQNVIPLHDLDTGCDGLLLFICRNMSGIPIYFSCTEDNSALSLEHAHPPASTVVYGDRTKAQKLMKSFWFAKLKP